MANKKHILLIGCTGFLGKSILFSLLKNTDYTIYYLIRNKKGISYKNRIPIILNSIKCDKSYLNRIIPINVDYIRNQNMKIVHDKAYCDDILNNVFCVINALADINFNRYIKKAVENNTLTALNWYNFFKKSKKKINYIYISTAYVNYHLENELVEEKIYEKNMDDSTLNNVLNGKIQSFKPYSNTYCYSKQLTEIILTKNQSTNIKLHIVRPSIIIPALNYPYTGYGATQNINLFFFGGITGTLPYIDLTTEHQLNSIVPVDIVSDCIIGKIETKESYSLSHCSYNCPQFTCSKMLEHMDFIYNNHDNLLINTYKVKPYVPMMTNGKLYYKIYAIVYYIIYQLFNGQSFNYIYKSIVFAYKFEQVYYFLKKRKIYLMRDKIENNDINPAILQYIKNNLVEDILLNPLFLK